MTSDNPIVCIQQLPDERPFDLGLNQKGAIKYFALSPDLLLIMMDETLRPVLIVNLVLLQRHVYQHTIKHYVINLMKLQLSNI